MNIEDFIDDPKCKASKLIKTLNNLSKLFNGNKIILKSSFRSPESWRHKQTNMNSPHLGYREEEKEIPRHIHINLKPKTPCL